MPGFSDIVCECESKPEWSGQGTRDLHGRVVRPMVISVASNFTLDHSNSKSREATLPCLPSLYNVIFGDGRWVGWPCAFELYSYLGTDQPQTAMPRPSKHPTFCELGVFTREMPSSQCD